MSNLTLRRLQNTNSSSNPRRNHPHPPASSPQQATSERPQNTPNKAWLQRILVIFNVFFLVLVSKLLPAAPLPAKASKQQSEAKFSGNPTQQTLNPWQDKGFLGCFLIFKYCQGKSAPFNHCYELHTILENHKQGNPDFSFSTFVLFHSSGRTKFPAVPNTHSVPQTPPRAGTQLCQLRPTGPHFSHPSLTFQKNAVS